MSDHLAPEEFFEFIDRGGGEGPAGDHLIDCPECLFELDFLLLAERPRQPRRTRSLMSCQRSLPKIC